MWKFLTHMDQQQQQQAAEAAVAAAEAGRSVAAVPPLMSAAGGGTGRQGTHIAAAAGPGGGVHGQGEGLAGIKCEQAEAEAEVEDALVVAESPPPAPFRGLPPPCLASSPDTHILWQVPQPQGDSPALPLFFPPQPLQHAAGSCHLLATSSAGNATGLTNVPPPPLAMPHHSAALGSGGSGGGGVNVCIPLPPFPAVSSCQSCSYFYGAGGEGATYWAPSTRPASQ